MLQKLVIAIPVFLVVLLALTFGESFADYLLEAFHYLTDIVVRNFSGVYHAVVDYVTQHTIKVLLALAITVPLTIWVARNKDVESINNRRKIAILLAIFLGWLGAHRFYRGQIGRGLIYILLFISFPAALVLFLSFIDAVRYWFMTDNEFMPQNKIES